MISKMISIYLTDSDGNFDYLVTGAFSGIQIFLSSKYTVGKIQTNLEQLETLKHLMNGL